MASWRLARRLSGLAVEIACSGCSAVVRVVPVLCLCLFLSTVPGLFLSTRRCLTAQLTYSPLPPSLSLSE